MWYYKRKGALWTVGIDTCSGWVTDSDWDDRDDARRAVNYLNGGSDYPGRVAQATNLEPPEVVPRTWKQPADCRRPSDG